MTCALTCTQVAVGLGAIGLGYYSLYRESPSPGLDDEQGALQPSAVSAAVAAETALPQQQQQPQQPRSLVEQLDEEAKHTSGRYWK